MRSTAVSLAFLGTLVVALPAAAAEIKEVEPIMVGDQQVQKLTLKGPIEPGDAEKIGTLIPEDGYTILSLDSDGGDQEEALAIAKVLGDSMVMTIVEDGASCLSACAIAFMGGNQDTDDSGDYAAARSIAPTARLGFTAPTLGIADPALTRPAVDAAYQRLLKTISDFVLASSAMHVEPEALGEIIKPRGTETYMVNDAYRLAHLGIEVQKVAPPAVLTASMARNLCQIGWEPTEGKPQAATDEAIARLNWKPADTSFDAKSTVFGEGLKVRRTLVPFGFMGDDPKDGYTFCIVDQTKWAGSLQVACRGFIYGDDLEAGMEHARHFDGDPDQGESGEPDIACSIPALIEPLTPLGTGSAANRWALVPGNTPLDKISETLAGYVAKEPPL